MTIEDSVFSTLRRFSGFRRGRPLQFNNLLTDATAQPDNKHLNVQYNDVSVCIGPSSGGNVKVLDGTGSKITRSAANLARDRPMASTCQHRLTVESPVLAKNGETQTRCRMPRSWDPLQRTTDAEVSAPQMSGRQPWELPSLTVGR